MSKNRFAAYFAIENRLINAGIKQERSELIMDFTKDQKRSLTELSAWEYNEFLNWLNRLFPSKATEDEVSRNNQRRKIISLFRKMGWQFGGKADMERIYAWVIKYGYLDKPLNEYTYQELPKLVTQVETIYTKFLTEE